MADNFNTNIKILNHKHFIELMNHFDNRWATRTYIGYAPLKKIIQWFPTTTDQTSTEIKLHLRIASNIKKAFKDHRRTVFTSEDYLPKGHSFELHFFNSLYRFLIDIRDGKGLYGPLSISKFKNGVCTIHPGSHRLAMVNVYNDPMMFVLTDYDFRNDLTKSKSKLSKRLHHIEDTEYNWRRGRWMHRSMDYSGVFHKSTGQEKQYKDLIDTFQDNEEHSYHRPELAERTYILHDNCVTVNDVPVVEMVNSMWRVVCV